MGVVFSNNCATTLSSAISTSDTTIAVADASAFPTLSGSDYTYATFEDVSNNVEVVKVTAISSNNLTVTRAQDGTTARAFSSGDRCQLRLCAAMLNDATFSGSYTDLTNVPSNIFTSALYTKLLNIENNATADQTAAEIKALYEAETNAFTDAQFTKLAGIETGATADQTGSQIKVLYEAMPNAFTDAQYNKLSAIEANATADQTGAEIKTLYEAQSSAFTDAQYTKLAGIEAGATADQTAAEIKSLYESTANAWSYAQYTKLAGIEAGATADQTDTEIEGAYNNEVPLVSSSEMTSGSSTVVKRFSPYHVKTMIDTHGATYTHPNHSGDVTSSGDGATTIANSAVTLAKMANMAENSFLGRGYVGTGVPQVLSASSARSILAHTNNKSTCVYAKYFSNATVKIYDSSTYNLEIWWDSQQMQIKYKPTASGWSYIDGSHLHVTGTSGSVNSATVTAWANDISPNYNVFQYISNDNNASTATANSTFNLDDLYGASDRFTLIRESHGSGFVAFHGIVFIGGTGSVAIQLWEIGQ